MSEKLDNEVFEIERIDGKVINGDANKLKLLATSYAVVMEVQDAYIKEEMKQMVDICHKYHVLCKVIFENCYLTKEEIKKLAEIAKEIKPDFIKTSTGFGPSGAKVEDVKLMYKTVSCEGLGVKASGGIKNYKQAIDLINAGASRLGTSSGVDIMLGEVKNV